jgi:hypothetical protein
MKPHIVDGALLWLVADNFVVLNRMCHAMGKLSSILVRFSSGRGTEVAQIGMNRRVMGGSGCIGSSKRK